jgi:phosphoglycerate dehydrogenase-like enzyme
MGNYTLDELINRWEREKLTTEQVVGQMLLILRSLTERVRDLERRRWKQEKSEGK